VVTANHHDGSAQDDVAGNEGGLAYLIGLFEDANLHANHTKRDYDKDIQLARRTHWAMTSTNVREKQTV